MCIIWPICSIGPNFMKSIFIWPPESHSLRSFHFTGWWSQFLLMVLFISNKMLWTYYFYLLYPPSLNQYLKSREADLNFLMWCQKSYYTCYPWWPVHHSTIVFSSGIGPTGYAGLFSFWKHLHFPLFPTPFLKMSFIGIKSRLNKWKGKMC